MHIYICANMYMHGTIWMVHQKLLGAYVYAFLGDVWLVLYVTMKTVFKKDSSCTMTVVD